MLQLRDVLRHFQRAEIASALVADGVIADVQELSLEWNPELGDVPGSRAEGLQDGVDHVDAFLRVAILHLAADDGGTSREYPFVVARVVADLVVLIHERELHRHAHQHAIELFERQDPRIQGDLAGCIRRDPGFRRAGRLRRPGARRWHDVTELVIPGTDSFPLLLRQHAQRGRQEDLLLFVDHFGDHARGLGSGLPHGGDIFLFAGGAQRLEHASHVVVDAPHDLGRAGEPMLLEIREELVLLPRVVCFHGGHRVQRLAQAVPVLRLRRLGHVPAAFREQVRPAHDLVVLGEIGVNGMSGGRLHVLVRLQAFAEHVHMKIAQLVNFADGHAFADEFLLHRGDFIRLNLSEQPGELRAGRGGILPFVQRADDSLERFGLRPVGSAGGSDCFDGGGGAGLLPDTGGQVLEKAFERDIADASHLLQGGDSPHRCAHGRVAENREFRMVPGEIVEQEGEGLQQLVNGGFRSERFHG